jgi:beta-glucanase (GH16 family)
VEWEENSIRWFVDGVQHHERVAGQPSSLFVPSWPMYIILNTAVQPWANSSIDYGFPTVHEIDSVMFCEKEQ